MSSLFDELALPGMPAPPARAGAGAGVGRRPAEFSASFDPDPGAGRAGAFELLEGLNPPQREAVTHSGSPLLIVAGAGSGKTRVLTHRVAYLLEARGARPGEILAITFTNKAAAEMRERVARLVGARSAAMWVSTFHSACVRILRREAGTLGLRPSFSIYDAADSQRMMALVCRDLDLDPKRYPPRAFSHRVSALKNELVDDETFSAQSAGGAPGEVVLASAYAAYQARLRQANALDFDDLIMTTVHLLQAFPQVAESYRRRFRHVLVDEYQDTNHAQYVLIRELVGTASPGQGESPGVIGPGELTVVGDADQSIYAFRGATIRNIAEFEDDYPNARTILLEQNYRSTQTILTAANAVIERNPERRPKRLWTDSGAGEQIVGYVGDDEHHEARFIAGEIDRLSDTEGVRPGEVAVFYRTNAQSRALEEVFVRVGLPYKVVGGTRFYERREVKDALAYLRLLANPDDTVNLRRILNVPKRGIGERAEAVVAALADRERIGFGEALGRAAEAPGIATRSLSAIRGFLASIDTLRALVDDGSGVATLLEAVLEHSGLLAELRASDDPQDESRIDNLAELVSVAQEFDQEAVQRLSGLLGPEVGGGAGEAERATAEEATAEAVEAEDADGAPVGSLAEFLERVSLVADSDQIPDDEGQNAGVVTLMTLHTAKGLEFPVVFLTGLEDGVFPHQRSLADVTQLAEERRLAYVGITRARRRLYVSRAELRSAWGQPSFNPASRFLDELPTDLVRWERTGGAMAGGYGGAQAGGYRSTGGGAFASSFSSGTGLATASSTAINRYATSPPASGTRAREIPHLVVGDKVTHDTFGLGTVVEIEGAGDRTVAHVEFRDQGVKRLLLRYAPLTKL